MPSAFAESEPFLFHITSQADWDTARDAGTYAPPSIETEGFIHLSSLDQVAGTGNRLYAGRSDHVVLAIDPSRADAEIRWEDLYDHGAEFPHLYGPLPTAAVHHSVPLEIDADGSMIISFDHHGGHVGPLAPDYTTARARFLDAAAGAGAVVVSSPHPQAGVDDEELFVDVATLGDPNQPNVLMVVSATHGVEGYCGSALQTHWLNEHAGAAPDHVTVVLIHAFNPYGFSWVRRVNEDNVDLNRNFIDWSSGSTPANEGYVEIADLLVPSTWSAAEQERTATELFGLVMERGLESMQAIISGGQYHHPTGVFYGGTEPVWSHRWLRDWAATALTAARDVAVLDLHTGLGAWGNCQLIGHEAADHPAHERAVAWWGPVVPMGGDDSVSAPLTGDWLGIVPELAPDARTTAVALEYGTVETLTVLEALRADAVLHGHGDPTSAEAGVIRDRVRAAFADDDPTWIRSCWPHFARAVNQAFDNLGR